MGDHISRLGIEVRKYHVFSAIWKACLFGGMGFLFSSRYDISIARSVLAAIAVIALSGLLEYLWFYKPSMSVHYELTKRFGSTYEEKLRDAIDRIGYRGIVSSSWISICHAEMVSNADR